MANIIVGLIVIVIIVYIITKLRKKKKGGFDHSYVVADIKTLKTIYS